MINYELRVEGLVILLKTWLTNVSIISLHSMPFRIWHSSTLSCLVIKYVFNINKFRPPVQHLFVAISMSPVVHGRASICPDRPSLMNSFALLLIFRRFFILSPLPCPVTHLVDVVDSVELSPLLKYNSRLNMRYIIAIPRNTHCMFSKFDIHTPTSCETC